MSKQTLVRALAVARRSWTVVAKRNCGTDAVACLPCSVNAIVGLILLRQVLDQSLNVDAWGTASSSYSPAKLYAKAPGPKDSLVRSIAVVKLIMQRQLEVLPDTKHSEKVF